ncbi:MAG: hypothetical protein ACYDBV_12465 [Nitrospiria bacterium]
MEIVRATNDEVFELCKRSFRCFTHFILGFNNPEFLDVLDDNLTEPEYKKFVSAYPRGHGKSTHLSIAYPLWLMAKDHNILIAIVSASSSLSQKMITGIIGQIESNVKYQEFSRYCDPKGIGVVPKKKILGSRRIEENWSGSSITIDRDDYSLKDSTIQALGLFGSVIGRRANVIIGDDLVDQKNSATEEQRQKTKDWFDTTLKPILIPGGKIVYLGNTWHNDDLVANLLSSPEWDFRDRLQAIISRPVHTELWQEWAKIRLNDDLEPQQRLKMANEYYTEHEKELEEGVKVLWPERMPYRDLYLLELSNPYSFARMYMCNPALRPDQKIKEDWLNKAKQKGKDLILQDAPREGMTMDLTTAGMDLAISLKSSADDTVLLTLDRVRYGTDTINKGDYVIRNIRRGKYTPNQVRTMVKTVNDNVKPLGIRVESVAYQESMVRDLWDMGMANVRGHKTGGEKNDIEIGINSLSILLENGKLVIPFDIKDPRTIENCSKLVDELRSWPDGHTGDSVMALWFAYLEARDLMGKRFVLPIDPSQQSPSDLSQIDMKAEERKADMEAMRAGEDARLKNRGGAEKKFVF